MVEKQRKDVPFFSNNTLPELILVLILVLVCDVTTLRNTSLTGQLSLSRLNLINYWFTWRRN